MTREDAAPGCRPVGRVLVPGQPGELLRPAWLVESDVPDPERSLRRRFYRSPRSGLLLPRQEPVRARAVEIQAPGLFRRLRGRTRPAPRPAPVARPRSRALATGLLVAALVGPAAFLAGRVSRPTAPATIARPAPGEGGSAFGVRGLLRIAPRPVPVARTGGPAEPVAPVAVEACGPQLPAPIAIAYPPPDPATPASPPVRYVPDVPSDPDLAVARVAELGEAEDWNAAGLLLDAFLDREPGVWALEALLSHSLAALRSMTAAALALHGRVDAFESILRLALTDPDPRVRSAGAGALLTLEPGRALDPVLQILSTDPDAAVRSEVLARLADVPGPAAGDALVSAFLDPDPELARIAGEALARRGSDDEARRILGALRSGPADEPRTGTGWRIVVRSLPYEEYAEDLRRRAAWAADDEARLEATDLLVATASPDAAPDLVAVYRSTASTEIHGRILRHLGRIDSPEARAFLEEEAAYGPSEAHRRTAELALAARP